MPLNNRKLHIIDYNEIGAHLWYEGCTCIPYQQHFVQNGENVIVYYHNQRVSTDEPRYKTFDEEGNIIPDKSEVCT